MAEEGSLAVPSGVLSLSEGSLGVGSLIFTILIEGSCNEAWEGSLNVCLYNCLIVELFEEALRGVVSGVLSLCVSGLGDISFGGCGSLI